MEEATDALKTTTEQPLAVLIKGIAFDQNKCSKILMDANSGASLALFGFAIYLLAAEAPAPVQMVVIIGYMVIEFFTHIMLFACLIFVALIPLLCLLICFYACCCAS